MKDWRRYVFPANRWLEPLFAIVIIGYIVQLALFFRTYHYLPQPFFYDPGDTWMDWFNTAYWAWNEGAYDSWATVYPPLTFIFLKLVSIPSCYPEAASGFEAVRTCDWLGIAAMHAIFLLNIVLIMISFWKIDRKTAVPRTIALAIGLPMLFGLERGNPFLICFTCVVLAFGPIFKSARWRWLAAGLAINFKVYLLAMLLPLAIRRKWRWLEGAVMMTVLVYLVTYLIMGSGTPREIWANLSGGAEYDLANPLDLWFATTYKPLLGLLNSSNFPIVLMIGSRFVDIGLFLVPLVIKIAQATLLIAVAAAWLRPEVVPTTRLLAIMVALAMITNETSGYSPTIVLFFVFMEKWDGLGRKFALVASYIYCIPGDIILDRVGQDIKFSFLSGREVIVEYMLNLGPFVRPLILISIAMALSCTIVHAVWVDIQRQGWKTRWRFRHDAPIMVGDGEARPPLLR